MTGLLKTLQDDALAARRAAISGDAAGTNAAFLVTVLAEAHAYAKAEQREPTDADADKAVRATIKQLTTVLNGNAEKGIEPLPAEADYANLVRSRLDALINYVPPALEGESLGYAIREAAVAADVPIEMKSMGKIMAVLNAAHPGQIDGAAVKALLLKGV